MFILIFLVFFVIGYAAAASVMGAISYAIGSSKGLKYSFWWGFGLGIIGIIVVACLEPAKEEPIVVKSNEQTETTEKVEETEKIESIENKEEKQEEEKEEEKKEN